MPILRKATPKMDISWPKLELMKGPYAANFLGIKTK